MTYSKTDKENFAQKMKEERNELYTIGKNQLHMVLNDPHYFIQFLELMARINYTVSNTLIVMNTKPGAREVKDADGWNKQNVRISKGEKGIRILLPDGTYTRRDGTQAQNYKIKSVFDVSQTNGSIREVKFDLVTLIRAVLYESGLQCLEGDGDKVVCDGQCIIYPSGYDDQRLFIQIVRIISQLEMQKSYNSSDTFIPLCIAYMMDVRFNVGLITENQLAMLSDQYFKKLNEDSGKNELIKIQKIYRKLNNRMYSYFKKERKNE